MRALHIIQRYPPAIGGSENWCRSLCEFSVSRGIATKVATMNLYNMEEFFKDLPVSQKQFTFGSDDYDRGVYVRRYKLWSFAANTLGVHLALFLLHVVRLQRTQIGCLFQHSPHSFEMYSQLGREMKDVDIVHLHTLPYFHNLVGFVIAKLHKKKIVITPYFHKGHELYEKPIFYFLMNHCDAVIVLTQNEKEHLAGKGVSERKILVTGCSIEKESCATGEDFEAFEKKFIAKYRPSRHAKKIIFIGRKDRHKGLDLLIEASRQLAEEVHEELFLLLVGPSISEFEEMYSRLGDTGRLRILDFGVVSEKDKECLIKMSDLLALPSEFESFGIVFLEAWRYKKPVVGSDRGAIPEVIQGAGLCAKHGDVADLKSKIRAILSDEKLARELGEAGKDKLANDYSAEVIGKKVLNVYRDLTKNKKKILLVSNLFPPKSSGGAEIVAYHQAKMLKKLGFDVNVFAGVRGEQERRFKITQEKNDFKITRINLHDNDFDRGTINYGKEEVQAAFRKALYEYAPDVVHFHNLYGLSAKLIEECKNAHFPSVITLHDYWFLCFKNTLITDRNAICQKKTLECPNCREDFSGGDRHLSVFEERNGAFLRQLNSVDLVISPSEYLMNRFVECGLKHPKRAVINNGIEVARFGKTRKINPKRICFGYVGQIIEHKGIDNLLHAVSLLTQEERKKVSLSVIGTGEWEFVNYCKGLARELKVADVVNFVGGVDNASVPKFFKRIDVLVVPSVWPENSPVTIMEALASGTPVLASDLGGIPELVSDGVHGFLHPHSDPEALAANMKKIIKHPEQLVSMQRACLEKAKKYDLKNQVSILAQHYDELMGFN